MVYYGLTDIGRHRADNQDTFAVRKIKERILLAVVCDGMGGAAGGKLASSLATEHFCNYLEKQIHTLFDSHIEITKENEAIIEKMMKEGAQEANSTVFNYAKDSIDLLGMGTTLVAALFVDNEVFICNVGDSRLYHFTAHSMKQITKDHSYVQMLVDNGLLEPSLAAAHPDRNVITRAVGTRALVTAETFRLTMGEKESVLLCTDGLSGYASNEEIYAIVWGNETIHSGPVENKVHRLIDIANGNGGRDNITAVLISS